MKRFCGIFIGMAIAIITHAQVYPDGPVAPEGYEHPAKIIFAWDPNPTNELVIGYRLYGGLNSGGPYHLLCTETNLMTNSYTYTTNFVLSEEVVEVGGFFETNVTATTNISQHVGVKLLAQDTDAVVTNLMRDSTLYFVATAYNRIGESLFSNEAQVKSITPAPPGSPSITKAREPDLVKVIFKMRDEPILVQKSTDLTNWTDFASLKLIDPYPKEILVSMLLPTTYNDQTFLRIDPPMLPAPPPPAPPTP